MAPSGGGVCSPCWRGAAGRCSSGGGCDYLHASAVYSGPRTGPSAVTESVLRSASFQGTAGEMQLEGTEAVRTESEGNNEHLKCKGVSVQWDESAVIATDCKDSRATSAVIARQGTEQGNDRPQPVPKTRKSDSCPK